jgi:hypothetical protein
MRRLALALVAAAALTASAGPSRATDATACGAPTVSAAYASRIGRVLNDGRDAWGERLLDARNGPTLEAASRLLPPLLYAAGHGGRPLTTSGVYYLPFTLPASVGGPRSFGLHVADGSEIIIRRVGGPRLMVEVGVTGSERFGSCLARLRTPQLADGYLPILEVDYTDGAGIRYSEESFVGRVPHTRSAASFLRIVADARDATRTATIRLVSSRGRVVRRPVTPGGVVELDAAFVFAGARLVPVASSVYTAARLSVTSFWQHTLTAAPTFTVPEARVQNAERALEVEELEMTWRYSVGNVYEELSYAEALDVAQVMAAYGYGDVSRQILRYTLRRLPARFTNWRAGERLVAGAQYYRLDRDRRYVTEETPGLRATVDRLARELAASRTGLLPRERYSSDIADEIYSLQGQTLVWEGLLAMGRVWTETGYTALADQSRVLALRLERGLRRAVQASEKRLADGSLFIPAALLDGDTPFQRLTASREGTYWNLVMPYALASGFFPAHGPEAAGLLRYLLLHGSRLLGLVRAGAYRLGGADEAVSGTDQVYGINVARFLADEDQSDQLVLSLYGTLAAALTPGTYVGGEAASVTPLHGAYFRTMYLPPNNDVAATFLETLRLMLVHETRGAEGAPRGLELAFATPRTWLDDGDTIAVHDAPTSFGPVSYSITRSGDDVQLDVTPPASPAPSTLRIRLRLPAGLHVANVEEAGRPVPFDARTGTVDLSGRRGALQLSATLGA